MYKNPILQNGTLIKIVLRGRCLSDSTYSNYPVTVKFLLDAFKFRMKFVRNKSP